MPRTNERDADVPRGLLRFVVVATAMSLLSGCRVFVFGTEPPTGRWFESEPVTVTNTTTDSYFVHIVADCGAVGAGFFIGDDVGRIEMIGLPGTTQSFVCSGDGDSPYLEVFTADARSTGRFVLEPGASITLRARVDAAYAPRLYGRSFLFDVYGAWCYQECYDMVRFT